MSGLSKLCGQIATPQELRALLNEQADEADKLRALLSEARDSLTQAVELLSMICEVLCVGNPPPHGVERLALARATLAKLEKVTP